MTIDITKIKKQKNIQVTKDTNYLIMPRKLSNATIEIKIVFDFNVSHTKSNIIFKCVAYENVNLDLIIELASENQKILDVSAYLELHVLNLSHTNDIKIQPVLRIPQENIQFEHKVTVGKPNDKWLKYLESRGINNQESIDLITKSFF